MGEAAGARPSPARHHGRPPVRVRVSAARIPAESGLRRSRSLAGAVQPPSSRRRGAPRTQARARRESPGCWPRRQPRIPRYAGSPAGWWGWSTTSTRRGDGPHPEPGISPVSDRRGSLVGDRSQAEGCETSVWCSMRLPRPPAGRPGRRPAPTGRGDCMPLRWSRIRAVHGWPEPFLPGAAGFGSRC